MDVENTKKYAKENNLCFGCLNAGHISKHCERRLKCRTCGRNHPTYLHGDIRKAEPNENSRDKITLFMNHNLYRLMQGELDHHSSKTMMA